MLTPDENNNIRQEKSLEQKLKMERLEVDGLQEDNTSSPAKSHSVEDERFENRLNPDVNDLSGPQDLSNSREADSAGSSPPSDSDDIEKDEEDVQKLLTEINNEAI